MSDGVKAARYLLENNSALIAQVPAARIIAGTLPQGTALPAIAVTQISGVELKTIGMNDAVKTVTERVQVTVFAPTYPVQKSLMRLIRAALPNQRGTVNTVSVDSIVPDMEGPDMFDSDINSCEQSQDFIVIFSR